MPPFVVNPNRIDPYKSFKFRVIWDGRPVAGITAVSGLVRSVDVVEIREGNAPSTQHRSPGLARFEPVTLERGLTHDKAFEDWANLVWSRGAETTLSAFRKDVAIELINEAGQVVLRYLLFRCWPSEYQALPELDASASVTAIERLVLQTEGWERDVSVTEPAES